jgi:hypothetical protein
MDLGIGRLAESTEIGAVGDEFTPQELFDDAGHGPHSCPSALINGAGIIRAWRIPR